MNIFALLSSDNEKRRREDDEEKMANKKFMTLSPINKCIVLAFILSYSDSISIKSLIGF
jgi:hypothetical protein